jgi:hypothetical protein
MRLQGNKWNARKYSSHTCKHVLPGSGRSQTARPPTDRALHRNVPKGWRKIHLGIDEQTLEVRAVEITGSHIGDAPVLPDLLSQIPADEEIASVTAPSRDIASRCPAGQWTVPTTHASATTQLPTAVRMPSSRPAKTPNLGRPSPQVRWPKTRPFELRNTLAARSGETGADTTAKAAPRRTLSGSCDA